MNTSRRRTRAFTVLALAGAPLLLAACGSSGSNTAGSNAGTGGGSAGGSLPKTLVFSPLTLQAPALKQLSVGVQAYAKAQGWKVTVQDPNFDPTKQAQDLASVISSKAAGAAWVIAVAPDTMGATLKAAQAKGVPILINGTPQEFGYDGPQPGITFDYQDYAANGKAVGEQLGKCLTEKNGGKGDVLFSVSSPGQAGKAEFEKAAQDALKAAAPGASIVQQVVVKDRAAGQTDIGNALQGHPDLVGVMSTTDEGSLGAMGAFDAAGKKLLCNVDFGGNDEVLADVKAGKIYASVALQFADDMKQSFDTLVKMYADPTANGEVLVVPQKTVTSAG